MRSIEDKGCLNNGSTKGMSGVSCMSFDFHKRASHNRTALGKPTPSKWDDAQKWLVNLSRGERNQPKASPRSSNADERRLIVPMPRKECMSNQEEIEISCPEPESVDQDEAETKTVDYDESIWRINKPINSSNSDARSICVRDMGTDMTPIGSQEPSRTTTPIRTAAPDARSPMPSESLAPVSFQNGATMALEASMEVKNELAKRAVGSARNVGGHGDEEETSKISENSMIEDQSRNPNPLEIRAVAWDEAERAKYMARYKREELKIQAWENHQKRKAEMEMRKIEVKAEQLKSRAQEKYTNKLTATRRIAEEKRANAEAILNEKAMQTSERADYIRRTGHLPSSFSFKCPSCCW